MNTLSPEDRETVSDCLDVIESETKKEKPRKGVIRGAITALKTVKGAAEFGTAVISLADFVGGIL